MLRDVVVLVPLARNEPPTLIDHLDVEVPPVVVFFKSLGSVVVVEGLPGQLDNSDL